MSLVSSVGPPAAGDPLRPTASGITHTFSSPSQRNATATMTERYSQAAAEDPAFDPDVTDLSSLTRSIRRMTNNQCSYYFRFS